MKKLLLLLLLVGVGFGAYHLLGRSGLPPQASCEMILENEKEYLQDAREMITNSSYSEAVELLEKMRDCKESAGKPIGSSIYHWLGRAQSLTVGQRQKGISNLSLALEGRPQDADIIIHLGLAHRFRAHELKKDDPTKAKIHFEKALDYFERGESLAPNYKEMTDSKKRTLNEYRIFIEKQNR